jgi:hypothetical protein
LKFKDIKFSHHRQEAKQSPPLWGSVCRQESYTGAVAAGQGVLASVKVKFPAALALSKVVVDTKKTLASEISHKVQAVTLRDTTEAPFQTKMAPLQRGHLIQNVPASCRLILT